MSCGRNARCRLLEVGTAAKHTNVNVSYVCLCHQQTLRIIDNLGIGFDRKVPEWKSNTESAMDVSVSNNTQYIASIDSGYSFHMSLSVLPNICACVCMCVCVCVCLCMCACICTCMCAEPMSVHEYM